MLTRPCAASCETNPGDQALEEGRHHREGGSPVFSEAHRALPSWWASLFLHADIPYEAPSAAHRSRKAWGRHGLKARTPSKTAPKPHRHLMVLLKNLVAALVFATLAFPALAANDPGARAPSPGWSHADAGIDGANCSRPRLTPEQRAERKALREQRQAQGMQHPPRTAEQKARAAARRAARCGNPPR